MIIFKSNKVYDVLKFISLVVFPASAALYLGLAAYWEWPDSEKIAGSLALINTFLGTVLQLSGIKYNNSDISVQGYLERNGMDDDTGHPNMKMTITTPPEEMLAGKAVRLRVGSPQDVDNQDTA